MATGLDRDHLRWLLSLNLSFPVKNVRRCATRGRGAARGGGARLPARRA
jgi:hypothetical protein